MELTEKEIEEIKNYKHLDEEKYIINYLSDTDVYKISMTQCLLHKRPNEWAKWKWKLRSKDVHLGYLVDAVNREVDHLCTLRWQPFELNALSKIYYIKPDYVDWLEDFRLKRKYIKITRRGLNESVGSTEQADIETGPLYEEASKKFDIYHIAVKDRATAYDHYESLIKKSFGKYLGDNLKISTIDELPNVIEKCIGQSIQNRGASFSTSFLNEDGGAIKW